MHKMPYKHIAATLKKTELACRLHYHQLSFGHKRRRRSTTSITSFTSVDESPASAIEYHSRHHELPQRPLPSFSPPNTPENRHQDSHNANEPPSSTTATPQSHKPILPKPFSSSSSRPSLPSTKGLRLITSDIDSTTKKPLVDIARLDRIYDAHRLHFWSVIARSYGCNLSPAALEEAWCAAHNIDATRELPPTPTASPDEEAASAATAESGKGRARYEKLLGAPFSAVTEYSKGFTAINGGEKAVGIMATPKSAVEDRAEGARGGFAISRLLTEDKEVRSPSMEKRGEVCEMQQ
ncbi:MAG: hypothetical protein LQ351_004394 [Letrouitia transgressa]|nr:MAG: hypothetical protein LQ351_004394 [Letrouitia transgressa]